MSEYDYAELGLVAGLEIHQQLDTDSKLFCGCPTELHDPETATRSFTRYLHPTASELGEIDEAALEESRVDRAFEYLSYDSTCLVEEDDEPPHRLNESALSVTLGIAQLLDMEPVDQGHIMRKIVVDGSNTTGFQRTMLVATDGAIETEHGTVRVEDLMLEEESAQRVSETDAGVRYSLDRLGIPLVEIGTKPDIESPAEARAAAERIGMLLRSTGSVKRGLGTIRQDVNVSITDGSRVEIKGVQRLEDIDDIVRTEVGRQVELLSIADELGVRGAAVADPIDVSSVFEHTDSGVLRSAISGGGRAVAVCLEGFDGLVSREIQPERRLGTEFADHARRNGAGGLFHTDELPAFGVSEEEVAELRAAVDADPADAVALVADDPEIAELAIEAVADRARGAIAGVPEETRGANEDGTTRYLRPLPGSARMYPETDVPPVEPDVTEVDRPELLTEKVERYEREYNLDAGLAEQVAFGRHMPTFEAAVAEGVDATLAASTLESTLTELRREDIPVEALTQSHLLNALSLVDAGDVPAEGLSDLLRELAADPEQTVTAAAERADLGGADDDAVYKAVRDVVDRNAEQVETEGMEAFSALMGECMAELRGKADGDIVSDVLREEIKRRA